MSLRPPVAVQRPERVAALPETMPGGAMWQVKLDGHRTIALVTPNGVILQARSGRIVTDRFPEVLPALATLPAGTVLDGEIVAMREGVFDFHALASTPRARRLAGASVSMVMFDALEIAGTVISSLPLADRWEQLQELLADSPAQLQLVFSTRDRAEAISWMAALGPIGVEGLIAKSLRAPYRSGVGHGWVKWRISETDDAEVIGHYGPAAKPTALRVRLADGRLVTTTNLDAMRARQVAVALEEGALPILVEVRVAGTGGRHERVEFVRVRPLE